MPTLWEAPLLGLGRPRRDAPIQISDLEPIPGNAVYYRRQPSKNPLAQSAPVHASGIKASPYISSRLARSTKQVFDPTDRDRTRPLQGPAVRPNKQLYYSSPMGPSVPRITASRLDRYQNLDTLNKLWNTFHIPEGERIYAYRQIQRNRTLAQAYYKRLTLILSYRHQYDEAMLNRQEVLQDLSRFLTKMKGSRIDLTYCITRLRYLTFKISSILNLARVICRKPVSYPDLALSVTDLANWNLYLKQEAFYTRNTTAIIFTVLKFFGQRTFQEVQNIVNKYFDRCTRGRNYLEKCSVLHGNRDPDISYSCVSRRSHLNISCIAPVHMEQPEEPDQDSSTRISEDDVSLYLLLGLDAEAIFDGDNLAVKWNEFLSKRNGAYFWEDDPLEMQRFGKSDWVPLLKPQNIRDMVVLEPMIQEDVAKMLKLLKENSEVPVTIPLRNDISPFETYFVRPCGKKRVLAKKSKVNKKLCERLAQPKHPPRKRSVSKNTTSSRVEKGKKPSVVAQNRPASCAAGARVQKIVKPPPPSTVTDTSQNPSDDLARKSLPILPAISTPTGALQVSLAGPAVQSHHTPQRHTASDTPSMLQIIETLMSVLPRLESPRNTQLYDRFIYLQKLSSTKKREKDGGSRIKPLDIKTNHHSSSFDSLLSSRPPLSGRHVKSSSTIPSLSQLNVTMIKTPKVGHALPASLESPVSSKFPACADRLWGELVELSRQFMEVDYHSRLFDQSSFAGSKNGLGRSTTMESIVDLPTSCFSPGHQPTVPKVIDINTDLTAIEDPGEVILSKISQSESPDFGTCNSVVSMAGHSLLRDVNCDDLTADLNSNLVASLPNEVSILSPPRDEYIASAAPYLSPVIDLSVLSTSVHDTVATPTPSSSQSPESPLLDKPLPHCATARKLENLSHIFVTVTSESTLCGGDDETQAFINPVHYSQLDITVHTSVDDPQPTPLELYGVPIMNFNKIVYKLDEKAIHKQPGLIQYREKFRFLHTEDRSSPDYDFIGGEFVPITKKPDGDTSENGDLLEYKDHYFDKPFLSKKFRKLEKKRNLLKQQCDSLELNNKPPKPKKIQPLRVKPRIPSAPEKSRLLGIPLKSSVIHETHQNEQESDKEEAIFNTILQTIAPHQNDMLSVPLESSEAAQTSRESSTKTLITQRPDLLLELTASAVSSSFRHLAEVSALSTPFTNASAEILAQELRNRNRLMHGQNKNQCKQGSSHLATELDIANLDTLTDGLIGNSLKSTTIPLLSASSSSNSLGVASQTQGVSVQPTQEDNS
ncbi:Hypothetical protein GSB_150255 [Giardia duodenalis]|uniref:Uncharacterized protein n=1 Tax=Giardia intestinalis TaxID=5741 RepID=V6U5G5_GIAIN|nr:Hypothetical protein GSB_150255 [Giardia intestinalis]